MGSMVCESLAFLCFEKYFLRVAYIATHFLRFDRGLLILKIELLGFAPQLNKDQLLSTFHLVLKQFLQV